MNKGRIEEFASPYQLLKNSDSQLYKMVEKAGPVVSRKLDQMALDNTSEWIRDFNIALLRLFVAILDIIIILNYGIVLL